MQQTVLVVGATGRTGGRVVKRLLEGGACVRAVVRSKDRLLPGIAAVPAFAGVEADLLALSEADLLAQVRGCDAVISCLGHTISLAGVFGPPRDLVTAAVRRLCGAILASGATRPVKLVLMSSVSVNHPGTVERRPGRFDRPLLWLLRGLVPPSRDNQRVADYLHREIGPRNPLLEWVCVRPDTLLDGDASSYAVHETLRSSLFRPDTTRMANVADFMCELVWSPGTWARWAGALPVIVDDARGA
jgi:nucleoside-diphosphate-sugar epimerase